MIEPLLTNPDEVKGIVTMAEAIDAVRLGFREWGEEPQFNAPRRRIHIPTGVRVSVHQGGVPGAGATGLMTHCEWVRPLSDHQEYPRLNHPVIVLYDAAEGELKAIIIGEITCSELPDNVAVTGVRTAATSALGTDLLARPDAERVGVFGAGGQARNHLLAFARIRKIKQVKVYSRTAENRLKFAAEMAPLLNVEVEPVSRPEDAVRGAEIILTATNSSVPVFDGRWIEPGAHVTSIVGSNVGLVKGGFTKAKRREIDDVTLARSDVRGIASIQQAIQDEQADIFDPVERGVIRWEQLVEIAAILAGKNDGRTKPEQITLFKNNAGQGVADVALGALVLEKVKQQGGGQPLKV
ncbi:MAG TPA: ornithine cyclodeaminase family protein [Candidatus Binatia bacterium]|jgi:ornithine cyclodeaminase/alanine dehydrogenase-like protein (mu-crystallin family)